MRHSKWDALLVALAIVHGRVLICAPSIPVIALGLWWNSNTISHNFIHLPFFRSTAANRLYAFYLSLLLGYPHSWWQERHLAHHSGVSPRTPISCSAVAEVILVLGMWLLLLTRAPQFFLTVYLPGFTAGVALCFIHGYFEHALGTKSNYGLLYNASFFNDGYHMEHHSCPAEHWTRLPQHVVPDAQTSRWPAVLRWIETVNLEMLERLVLRSPLLQVFLLNTHERSLRRLLPKLGPVHTIHVVGGAMFPLTAILLHRLLPNAAITIIDANAASIETAKPFLDGGVKLVHAFFEAGTHANADLIVIPLSFNGDRERLYQNPPTANVLLHDWIWAKRSAYCADGRVVSPWLLKRLNLIQR